MAAHARYSASAAQRWLHCPVSVRWSAGLDTGGRDADEGTLAHALANAALVLGGVDKALQQDEFKVDEESDKPQVDDAMIEHVTDYIEWLQALVDRHPGCEWEVETSLDLSDIHPLAGGTADFLIYDPAAKLLHVVDFKYGRGKIVEPAGNPQCLNYLLGALMRYHNRGVRRARITIYQPRGQHPEGTIRTWETDLTEILAFAVQVREAIERAEHPDHQKPVAGYWCKDGFCAARATCPAYREQTLALAMAEFDEAPDGTIALSLPSLPQLTMKQRLALLDAADQILDWIKQVQAEAHDKAMAGDVPPGWKLVPKRATRKWTVDETEILARAVVHHGDIDVVAPRKLLSVAKMETALGKKNFPNIFEKGKHFEPISSGYNLARESDPRQARTKASAEDDFS